MRALKRLARVLWDAFDRFLCNDGSAMAGAIAFSGLLSLFPFMIFAAMLFGVMVGPSESDRIIDALFDIAPEHVALTLEPVVVEVLHKQSGEVLTVSGVFAIWVASSAVEAFRIAFDRAYTVDDPRSFLHNRVMAIGMVFLGALVAMLLGVSILLSPLMLHLADELAVVPMPALTSWLTYGFGVAVFVAFLLVMHRTLPGRRLERARLWPGVLVTTVLWVALAWGFSTYLSYTPTYTVIYGTLAGVIITLMFLYLTGATIIFGAEVNAAFGRLDPGGD